jgi:ElaB/YqjD/DUF883 family membrane-anchored ribosome-binding protein
MHTKTNNMIHKAGGVASSIVDKLESSGDQVEKIAHSLGEKAGEITADLSKVAADKLKVSREYITENPLTGIAVAATAGVVAGSIATMIMSGKKEK